MPGFWVHDGAYMNTRAPDPLCCSDPKVLCRRCAALALGVPSGDLYDAAEGLTGNAAGDDGFTDAELSRYLNGFTPRRGRRDDVDDDKLEVPAMEFDELPDRPRGRQRRRQADEHDLSGGDPLTAYQMLD